MRRPALPTWEWSSASYVAWFTWLPASARKKEHESEQHGCRFGLARILLCPFGYRSASSYVGQSLETLSKSADKIARRLTLAPVGASS